MNSGIFNGIEKDFKSRGIVFVCGKEERDENSLYQSEKSFVEGANRSRIIEFASGRFYARKALLSIGISDTAILCGKFGEPVFPEGTAGSISHSDNLYSVAVCRSDNFVSVGIDLESIGREISDSALSLIANEDERVLIDKDSDCNFVRLLIFSAKESVFKALSIIADRRFYFDEVSIFPSKDAGRLDIKIHNRLEKKIPAGLSVSGGYFCDNSYIFTYCLVTL
jgi:4'-phosphopantetheinyl transferase EntD